MNLFLYGFSNSGKTTIFNLISKKHQEPSLSYTLEMQPAQGTSFIIDERVYSIKNIFPQREAKFTPVQITDYMGILKDTKHNTQVLNMAQKSDILIYIIRNFSNQEVPSPVDEINPMKEFKLLRQEALLKDLQIIETRLNSIKDMEKKGKKGDPKEKEFLEKFKEFIESGEGKLNLKEEKKKFPHLSFLSWLPFCVLINSDDKGVEGDLVEFLEKERIPFFKVLGKVEEEAMELGEEGKEWLISYGIEKPFREWFLWQLFKKLGYISFITIGDKEIKSWVVEDGINAYEAAGKIHTDIQKGFIKAEVLSFEDFMNFKDFHRAREAGVLKFEGKEYKVKDGDVIYFRFH